MTTEERQEPKAKIPIAYDLTSHHALGGGSYVFKSNYPSYLKSLLSPRFKRLEVNIIIQPNSSPHIGTLCSLGLAFVIARRLQDLGLDVVLRCDLWDQARGEQKEINGTQYQRSLRDTGRFQQYLPEYTYILERLAEKYAVPYLLRFEDEFLRQPEVVSVIRDIIQDRAELGKYLMPSTGTLALRGPCPTCGLVDKYGVNNVYAEDGSSVSFRCPHHGTFSYNIQTTSVPIQLPTFQSHHGLLL